MKTKGAITTFLQPAILWAEGFNKLSLRERALVSAGVLALTWVAWFFLINPVFSKSLASAQRQLSMAEAELKTSAVRRIELTELAQQDPNKRTIEETAAVRADLVTMKSNLLKSLSQFIAPSSMTLVLRDLMADHKNLKLTRLSRLPARKLLPEEEATNLYMHPLELELEGEYLEVLDYIASLENGDWQFNWQKFEYKTKGYPNGVATFEIETLSREKHWLGL